MSPSFGRLRPRQARRRARVVRSTRARFGMTSRAAFKADLTLGLGKVAFDYMAK
jgi:hypothetical protein